MNESTRDSVIDLMNENTRLRVLLDAANAYRAGQEEMRERAAVRMIEVMKQYRNDAFTHLGLGDIRLSIGSQEDLAEDIRAMPIRD